MALWEMLLHFVSSTVSVLILWIIVVVSYRLSFHPLAKYPGPFLAKVTDWYFVYHAWKGDSHLELWRGHEKYGKFVRFGPNKLSINSNSGLKAIYGYQSNVRKSDFYSAFPPNKDTFNTHNCIDRGRHARKRRVLSHAFSENALKSMEKYMLANIRTFCRSLSQHPNSKDEANKSIEEHSEQWNVARNMTDWCNYLAFDVMGDLCFGKGFALLESDENRFAVDLTSNASRRHLIVSSTDPMLRIHSNLKKCGTLPMIHEYYLDKLLFHKIAAGRARYMAYSKSQAAARMKLGQNTDRKDFFYYLLHAKDQETGKGFSQPELWGESNLLIIAGSDTTSTALAGSFFFLAHNPNAYKKVVDEVRLAFNELEEIHSGPHLNSCTYLTACIDEAMRLSPPVPGILPRQVLPGGMSIDDHHFPEGIDVGTSAYAIHHHPEYFADPFSYKPERWIVDPPEVSEEAVTLAQSAFCPFSVGPRACIGRSMAYMELKIALSRTLFMYDMRLAPRTNLGEGRADLEWGRQRVGEFQLRDTFTAAKNGPLVQFRFREGLHL